MDIRHTFEELDQQFTSYGGLPEGGITRLLYSSEWKQAHKALITLFETNGFQTRTDDIGNLIGRIEGQTYADEVIMTGSHLDTVIEGGHLDGQYGILAAFIATKYLLNKYGIPKRSIEVLALAEEEGSRFPYSFWGSKSFFNIADVKDVIDIVDNDNIRFVDAMKEAGFQFRQDNNVRDDIKAFIEIHIEQGKVLETENKKIGVVNGIVGQKRYTVTLKGEANHAGTTPMGLRRDVIVAYSEIVQTLTARAREIGDPLVITFGHVTLSPNVVNVVPGEIEFSVDTRHIDEVALNAFASEVEQTIKTIAHKHDMAASLNLWMDETPTLMNPEIVQYVNDAASKVVGEAYKTMPSGAGHDAQIFAQHVPTGMIFVPSINGVSHNVEEETEVDDLVNGIEVLIEVIYKLAY